MSLLGTTTAESSLKKAKDSLNSEVGEMKVAQEKSLNVFRQTVADLSGQNEQLYQKRTMALEMANDMKALADGADDQIGENSKVINKITEFLD